MHGIANDKVICQLLKGVKICVFIANENNVLLYWWQAEALCHFQNASSDKFRGMYQWYIFGFREKWQSSALQTVENGGRTVSYSCINTKSAWRSAADVKVLLTSSIFLPVPSRPPCCSAPHYVRLCRVKGVELRAPIGHQPLDTCAYESQLRCQHCDQHASHSCLTHACKTTLSVQADSWGLSIYYPQTAQRPWW